MDNIRPFAQRDTSDYRDDYINDPRLEVIRKRLRDLSSDLMIAGLNLREARGDQEASIPRNDDMGEEALAEQARCYRAMAESTDDLLALRRELRRAPNAIER